MVTTAGSLPLVWMRLGLQALHRSAVVSRTMTTNTGPVAATIYKKLQHHLEPEHCEVINESHMHNVPKGSESHFKVVVVSKKFENMPLIKRHRLVNHALSEQLESGVHALAIVAKSPEQWQGCGGVVDQSPACRGGAGL